MELENAVRELLTGMGADLVGFADVEGLSSFDYPRAVSAAIALPVKVIEEIPIGPTPEYLDVYNDYNRRLDLMAEAVAELFVSKGFRAYPQTLERTVWNRDEMITALPHKTVATRAGLGWIGKCALLVTPQFGSAIRLTSVLTDAHLEVGTPITTSRCGFCQNCVNACPGNAVTGVLWHAGIAREELVTLSDCKRAAGALAEKTLGYATTMCGRCFAACPYTQAYVKRAKER